MMSDYSRILFITINGWNNTTGTVTIPSIIEGYPSDCVANIFIRPDIPNSTVCNRYYNISELDVVKSCFVSKVDPGSVVCENDQLKKTNEERKIHSNIKIIKVPFMNYIRDFFWKKSSWKNYKLKEFVSEFNPDIIAFPAEGIISFLELAEYIIDLTKKPYLMFFWDDNFTYKSHGFSLYRFLLRKKIKKVTEKSSGAFAITPKMQRECEKYFGISPIQITRPINQSAKSDYAKKEENEIKILYAGSLYIDRYKTLQLLVDEIKKIDSTPVKFKLDIFTNSEPKQKQREKLVIPGISQIHAGVKKEEIYRLQKEADILLFVEALRGRYKNAARLSFSTKITDYLSANRCILAIGPSDIAPIEYLAEKDAALIASNRDEIRCVLQRIIAEKDEILQEYAKKAYNCGKEYHSKEKIFEQFCDVVKGLMES